MYRAIALLAAIAVVGVASPAPARAQAGGHSERLAARARRGDRAARATLVDEHMGIVRSVALRYRDLGLPVEDLVQEGAIGLLAAVDDYDSNRGTSFSTYAFWRVRAAVTHALTARANLVRVPRPVLERRREVAATQSVLAATGSAPSVRDLSVATALPPDLVAEALAPPGVLSLDSPLPDGSTLADRLADDPAAGPEAVVVTALETRALRHALRRLRPHLQTIVKRHFGIDREPEALTTIASDLRLSPERTRALKDEALRKLASDLASVA
jgi:RNA polymerase nonessential primary-like sigma factor